MSNANREEIRRLDEIIYQHISRGRYEEGEVAVKRSLALLKEEGLDNPASVARVAYDGYQGRLFAKDREGAKRWLTLVIDMQRLSDRTKGPEVRRLEGLLRDLETNSIS